MFQITNDVQELADMGLIFFVYDNDEDIDPAGIRLTELGVKLSEELYPGTPLHESYYKWQFDTAMKG